MTSTLRSTLRHALPWLAASFAPPVGAADGSAWQWGAGYKFDALHASAPAGTAVMGHLSLRADADAERAFGWTATTLHAEALVDHGGKLNRRVGSLQGLSNIEVSDNAARLYSLWLQRQLTPEVSALIGLYDLNSEFYATEASGLLIHPAFGIGSEMAQSGRNGPSIFPNLSLGLRVKAALGGGGYVQAALLDGVPGDPARPGATTVRLGGGDGALLVAEAGWQGGDAALPVRWALGGWTYTRPSPRIDGSGDGRQRGVYALAQGALIDRAEGRTTGFVRAGLAEPRLHASLAAWDAGVLVDRPFGANGPAAFTAGLAVAVLGRAYRNSASGAPLAAREAALETSLRWQLSKQIAVQPLLQRVVKVGGQPGVAATVAGLRIEWSLGND